MIIFNFVGHCTFIRHTHENYFLCLALQPDFLNGSARLGVAFDGQNMVPENLTGNHREISGIDFKIGCFADDDLTGNNIFNLSGENALYALIHVAKVENWQIFDTGNGEMIDLEPVILNRSRPAVL
jgi:hypothetical protein